MIREKRVPSIRFGETIRVQPEAIGVRFRKEETVVPPPPEPVEAVKKKVEDLFLGRLRPKMEEAFRRIPSYGEVGIRVVLHDSQVVRVEHSICILKKVDLKTKT